jgi:hypothetical protein
MKNKIALFIFRDQARHHIKPAAQHMPPNQVAHHGIMTQLTSHKLFHDQKKISHPPC